jgi:hypothetical protein
LAGSLRSGCSSRVTVPCKRPRKAKNEALPGAVERREGSGWTVMNLLAGLILGKRGYGVKGALKGSSGVFRNGHSSIHCSQRQGCPRAHAPGQPHEGLRSYYWGAFREGTGAETLRDPAKGGVSEQIVDRS